MAKITQTAGRNALGTFAPEFAHFNDDVLFGAGGMPRGPCGPAGHRRGRRSGRYADGRHYHHPRREVRRRLHLRQQVYGHLHGAVAHHDAAVVFGGVIKSKRPRKKSRGRFCIIGRLSFVQPLSLLRRQGRVAAPSVCCAAACILLAAAPTATPCFRRWRRSSPLPLVGEPLAKRRSFTKCQGLPSVGEVASRSDDGEV